MSDSTRRAIRTAIDLVLGLLASAAAVLIIPGVSESLTDMGLGEQLTTFSVIVLALTAFFNKLKNTLEDAGIIPAVLKEDDEIVSLIDSSSEGEYGEDEVDEDDLVDAEPDEDVPTESPYTGALTPRQEGEV